MRLNRLGRAAMNSAARAFAQRHYVARAMEKLGGRVDEGHALEIGCGRGVGVEIILARFEAARVDAFDLDPRMVDLARRRLRSQTRGTVTVTEGDAMAIPAADATYDAVFDFGAIHIVPEWPRALSEVRRVLRPGGRYYFEWVTNRLYRSAYLIGAEGFQRMPPPRWRDVIRELEEGGMAVRFIRPRIAAATQLVGDLIGVGRLSG